MVTRARSCGIALSDSPVGQAAWLYEKFHNWTDHDAGADSALTRDEMLDDITLHWLTDTAASSARICLENAGAAPNAGVVELSGRMQYPSARNYSPPAQLGRALLSPSHLLE